MEEKQYLKFKPRFKLNGILGMISDLLIIFTLFFIIFVPCFKIKEDFFGFEVASLSFSFFDEIKLLIKLITSSNQSIEMSYIVMYGMFELMAMVSVIVIVVMVVSNSIKSITNFINLDNYALLEYDKIKQRANGTMTKKLQSLKIFSLFWMALIYGLMGVLLRVVLGRSDVPTSYFQVVNDVTPGLYFAIIFILSIIGLNIAKSILSERLKADIIKSDYQVEATANDKSQE